MSDNFLRLIPEELSSTPDAGAVAAAQRALARIFPPGTHIEARMTKELVFVDQGANFESVACGKCGTELDSGWWAEQMDRASATSFVDLHVVTPCCSHLTTLHDLRYNWPAGFARIVLEICNHEGGWLGDGELRLIEEALGCRIRQIMSHY